MAVLLQDDFDRANSAVSPGSPVVGGPYTVQSGTWGISSNELYLATPAAGVQMTFPAAANVDISWKSVLGAPSQTGAGVMFRWVDINNHWLFNRSPTQTGQVCLQRVVAGVANSVTADVASVAGDLMRVKAYDRIIEVYLNGEQIGQVEDQWFGNGATIAGVRNLGTATARWDDLLVQTQDQPLNYWGAAPEAFDGLDLSSDAEVVYVPAMYKGRNTGLADENGIV